MSRTLVVIAALLFTLNALAASKSEEFRIYATSQRHRNEFNKFAYFSLELRKTAQAFAKDPRQFDKMVRVKDEIIVIPQSLDQVISQKAASLNRELKPTDYELVKAGAALLPVPSWVTKAGDLAFKLIPEFNDKNPNVSRELQEQALRTAYDEVEKGGPVGDAIRNASTQWIGAAPDAVFTDSDPVVREGTRREQLRAMGDANKRLGGVADDIKQTKDSLTALEANYQVLRKAQLDKAAAEKVEADYQKTRAEVLGALELTGYAARALGDKDLATLASASAYAFGRFSELVHRASEMGSVALTAGYVGATLATIDMLKGGSADATAAALAQISAQIQEVRVEMHERFDRVDTTLNAIWDDLHTGLTQLAQQAAANNAELQNQLQQVRSDLLRSERRVIDLSYALSVAEKRIEATIAQTRMNDLKQRTNLLLKAKRNTITPAVLDETLLYIDTFVAQELSAIPFSEPLENWTSLPANDQIARLSFSNEVDVTATLQVLSVLFNKRQGNPSPPAVPNAAAWRTVADNYLQIVKQRSFDFPELATASALDQLISTGDTLFVRWNALFGTEPHARATLDLAYGDYREALNGAIAMIQSKVVAIEKDKAQGVEVFKSVDEAIVDETKRQSLSTGDIDRCENFIDICKAHVGVNFCKQTDHMSVSCANPYRGCEDRAKGWESTKALSSVEIKKDLVPQGFQLANRLGLVKLRTCYRIAGGHLPNTTREQQKQANLEGNSQAYLRLLVRAESADAGNENIGELWVTMLCPWCAQKWRQIWKSSEERDIEARNYAWNMPGGWKDRYLQADVSPVSYQVPTKVSADYQKMLDLRQQCFGDEVPDAATANGCWPSAVFENKPNFRKFPGNPYAEFDSYVDGKQVAGYQMSDHVKNRPWVHFWTEDRPRWRIKRYESAINALTDRRLSEVRRLVVAELAQDAIAGDLQIALVRLDATCLALEGAVRLGYQKSFVQDDSLRALFRGHQQTALPCSVAIVAGLAGTDPTWMNVPSVIRTTAENADLTRDRLARLGPGEDYEPMLSALQALRQIRGSEPASSASSAAIE